jgi:hypothetical protein
MGNRKSLLLIIEVNHFSIMQSKINKRSNFKIIKIIKKEIIQIRNKKNNLIKNIKKMIKINQNLQMRTQMIT